MQQLEVESTVKWRVEERNDWKNLVDAAQKDRTELQKDNKRLKVRLQELTAQYTEQAQQRSRAGSPGLAVPTTPPPASSLRVDVQAPSNIAHERVRRLRSESPRSPQLRRELQLIREQLAQERSTIETERREAERLRKELASRRRESVVRRTQSGLLVQIMNMTTSVSNHRLFQRQRSLESSPVMNV